MGHGPSVNNPLILSAFHDALRLQALAALLVIVLALLLWQPLARLARQRLEVSPSVPVPEPEGRRLLRIGFGVLWVLDGVLQTQQGMVIGLPSSVVHPAADGSPAWVRHVVAAGVGVWTRHPIAAASSVVWIQLSLGLLLLFAPRWGLSRLAGLATVPWALAVWVFGEAFGGVFAPGGSWLFGWPGAVLLYAVAGGVLALPARAWIGPRLGRRLLTGYGVVMLGMAVLQAWPGRGFWEGGAGGQLSAMARSMSATPQPGPMSAAVRAFGHFDTASAFAVNVVVVAALALIGAALLSGRRRITLAGLAVGELLCLATWVLVQDMGWFGGVGTDPNSMVPWGLLLGGGYLAWRRATAAAPADAPVLVPVAAPGGRLARLVALPAAAVTATVAAVGILVIGVVPAASAAVQPGSSMLLVEAINGTPLQESTTAPGWGDLVDQRGRPVSLASLRGRVIALTFLDPVCTSDCPLIAQQFHRADEAIRAPGGTAFVAIVANPVYRSPAVVRAFDQQEALSGVHNWYFLTGSEPALSRAWRNYGIEVQTLQAGAMVAHSEQAFVIDADGRLRWSFGSDPGNAPASLAAEVAREVRSVLG